MMTCGLGFIYMSAIDNPLYEMSYPMNSPVARRNAAPFFCKLDLKF